ncbi:MAG: hypothetical protein ACLR0U_10100 [Enterocloster clostridioformis]
MKKPVENADRMWTLPAVKRCRGRDSPAAGWTSESGCGPAGTLRGKTMTVDCRVIIIGENGVNW